MTQENLFSSETQTQTTPDVSPEDLLKNIKNENGEQKYKDVLTALNALQHSQNFIQNLKQEKTGEVAERDAQIAQLKLELEKRASVEDIVKSLTTPKPTNTQSTDPTPVNVVDEQKVLSLVEQALQRQSQQTLTQNNLAMVNKAITDKFGDKAKDKIKEVAAKVNTSTEQLQELAKNNPALVLSLFETVPVDKSIPTFKNSNELNLQPTQAKPRSVMKGGMSGKEVTEVWKQHGTKVLAELGLTT
jgi:hypothetical protein